MDALNSLPVIDLEPVNSKPAPRRPKTPEVSAPVPKEHQALAKQLVEVGYDKFIVAKSISIFGNDEEKCFGKVINKKRKHRFYRRMKNKFCRIFNFDRAYIY